MKKNLFLAAAAVAMLASCSQNDLEAPVVAEAQQTAIEFGTYLGKAATSRAGWAGAMTNDNLKESSKSNGFGVFGFYTNNGDYSATESPVNFMYNEHLTWNDKWEYSPLKYWPNETANGIVDQNDANATNADKLTFFAYAPYVATTNEGTFSPAETEGITKLTGNDIDGDPKVYYTIASDADNTVDLLWGVVPESTEYSIAQSSTKQAPNVGLPNLNLTKQTINETVDFSLRHALAKITFTVQGAFNELTPTNNDVDGSTRIVIDNVAIETEFHKSGILNLNNTVPNTPNWTTAGSGNISFNINNDDIVAGTAGAAGLKYSGTDTYESQPLGVTKTKQYLMDADGTTKYFTVIPEEDKDVTITITYRVYTVDSKLKSGFSVVENVITKTIDDFDAVGGKAYNINLLLGMTSVKVDATVANWEDAAETPVNLPINVN